MFKSYELQHRAIMILDNLECIFVEVAVVPWVRDTPFVLFKVRYLIAILIVDLHRYHDAIFIDAQPDRDSRCWATSRKQLNAVLSGPQLICNDCSGFLEFHPEDSVARRLTCQSVREGI